MTISKMSTALLPVQYSLNLNFWLINGYKKETLLYRVFKSSLDKRYEVSLPNINILKSVTRPSQKRGLDNFQFHIG